MLNSGPDLNNFIWLLLSQCNSVWLTTSGFGKPDYCEKLPVQYVEADMSTGSTKNTADGPAGKSSKSVAD